MTEKNNVKHIKPKVMNKLLIPIFLMLVYSCAPRQEQSAGTTDEVSEDAGQSRVQDDVSVPDVVRVAVSSPDHTTLVAALKTAGYVDELSNAGPFTVFAPTNAAFEKLPPGTVETLVKPENREKLRYILEYHVYVGSLSDNFLRDGMNLNQVNLQNVSIAKKDGKITVNGANVVATIKAANGYVHVIDAVLLPPDKK